MPDEGSDEGIVVHQLESAFGFLSPLITQLTGRPGIKSRATRATFTRSFDVVHFHNISLVGGPAVMTQSKAPVNLYTLHDHWLLCPTHVFWKNNSKPCDRPTCFSCSLASRIPPQLWRYTRLVQRSIAGVDAILAPSENTATLHRAFAAYPRPAVVLSNRTSNRTYSATRPATFPVCRSTDGFERHCGVASGVRWSASLRFTSCRRGGIAGPIGAPLRRLFEYPLPWPKAPS